MKPKDYLATEKLPTTWCLGCSLNTVLNETAGSFCELKIKKDKLTIVSGIGCTGRSSGYFSTDGVHTPHGRAIPVAEGIKHANPKMNVVVISGDGDLLSIGLNHLMHASRRNINITVICVTNQVYGLTGGQLAPTTQKKGKTLTSPKGSDIEPINVQGIITLNKNHFYARTTPFHGKHMKECIKQAVGWKGFSFVEIVTMCHTNYGRRMGYDQKQIVCDIKKDFKIKTGFKLLKDKEIGITKNHD